MAKNNYISDELLAAYLEGNVNMDDMGQVFQAAAADAELLQKFLLSSGELDADAAKAADINADSRLDAADLSRLKAIILTS